MSKQEKVFVTICMALSGVYMAVEVMSAVVSMDNVYVALVCCVVVGLWLAWGTVLAVKIWRKQ